MRKILESSLTTLRRRVLKEAKKDIELGFLLAEFDFEWLLRRMVLCFATCPTVVVRSLLKKCHGFDLYVDTWNKCVVPFRPNCPMLQDILKIPSKNQIKKGAIGKAFLKRHLLVHGVRTGIGTVSALVGLDVFLESAEQLVRFAEAQGVDLFKKMSPRHRKCLFCPVGKQKEREIQNAECIRGVLGVCPFVGNEKFASQIRRGIREQRKARLGKGVKMSFAEVEAIAKKYRLETSEQVKQVVDRLKKGL